MSVGDKFAATGKRLSASATTLDLPGVCCDVNEYACRSASQRSTRLVATVDSLTLVVLRIWTDGLLSDRSVK